MPRGQVTVKPRPVKVIPGTALAEEIAYNAARTARQARKGGARLGRD